MLLRTKTSGAGKKVEVLPFFIAEQAWIDYPEWLFVGFEIWERWSSERDFFLVLPEGGLEAVTGVEAQYADGASMTRCLHLSLKGPSDWRLPSARDGCRAAAAAGEKVDVLSTDAEQQLLLPEAVGFWTEHSERACMPTWADSLARFPKDWIDMLGRWSPGASAGYVRTFRLRVATMQAMVASTIRCCANISKIDFSDEESLLEELIAWCRKKRLPPGEVEAMVSRLRLFEKPLKLDGDVFGRKAIVTDRERDEMVFDPRWLSGPPGGGSIGLLPLQDLDESPNASEGVAPVSPLDEGEHLRESTAERVLWQTPLEAPESAAVPAAHELLAPEEQAVWNDGDSGNEGLEDVYLSTDHEMLAPSKLEPVSPDGEDKDPSSWTTETGRAKRRGPRLLFSDRLPPDERGYVVSVQVRTNFKCLHFLGACHRIPGLDYRHFELLGIEKPEQHKYHTICNDCWPGTSTLSEGEDTSEGQDGESLEDGLSDRGGETPHTLAEVELSDEEPTEAAARLFQ
jgi:hypothetical protein